PTTVYRLNGDLQLRISKQQEKPRINQATMKKYFITLTIASALALSVVIIGKKAHAQNTTNTKDSSPVYVTEIPPGYRDWKVVSVAHEAGDLIDIRAILGNDIAIKAYRQNKLPFPEGAIVGRIAWSYVPSEENNKTFGRDQSFVAGSPTDFYLQFMV